MSQGQLASKDDLNDAVGAMKAEFKVDLNDAVTRLTAVLQAQYATVHASIRVTTTAFREELGIIRTTQKTILDKVNEHSVTLGKHSDQLLNLQHRMPPPDNPGGRHF